METKDLYSTYITNCVFNAFLSYTAIMLNIVTIHAIRKTVSLPKPLKTFLLSLSVSDLGVGLFVQPSYIGHLVMKLEQNTESNSTFNTICISIAYRTTAYLFAFASFFGVVALSVDRFLAIHLHLRYQELVTHKRVAAVVISIWVLSAILSLVAFTNSENIDDVIRAIIAAACIIITTFLNYKIYETVRRHANQIQAFQVQQPTQNDEMANVGRLKKSAVTTAYVFLVFLVCYLPKSCTFWIKAITPESSTDIYMTELYFFTLVFLNLSLNPLIYCLKMRHIRHNAINMFRNAFSCSTEERVHESFC